MIDTKGRFEIENYGKKSVFAGFLPGISGIFGIPIWCYYVNRGQCISCFGTEDKDHAIMEFKPAHQAYTDTRKMGFRTFLQVNGVYYEPFSEENTAHSMYVDKNTLSITENNTRSKITTDVTYFTLPEEKVGALVRKVSFTSNAEEEVGLEILDGCPALLPYGVDMSSMKNMAQTAKAWMQVEDAAEGKPYFRVRASMADSTRVSAIEAGNFSICVDKAGKRLLPVVDTEVIFDYDTSLEKPRIFMEEGLDGVLFRKQNTMNMVPCCFYGDKITLKPGEAYTLYQVIGEAASKELFHEYLTKNLTKDYFEEKLLRAITLTEEITQAIETKTANPAFDAYCRQTYLDNVLRGGMPISLGKKELFYVYARKHGDMERDYNYFRILPEFFSQGNGNFRDINQNRRCDTSFSPQVGRKNIRMFYDFIQLDGYNPLGVEKTTYQLTKEKLQKAAELLAQKEEALAFLLKPFTPGSLAAYLTAKDSIGPEELAAKTGEIIDMADSLVNSEFLEGYWCDHWTYNLDLIENYLSIYPEKEYDLLYEDCSYVYMNPGAYVNPRSMRYTATDKGIRQHNAVSGAACGKQQQKVLLDKQGQVVHTTLMEKLILLNCLKFATLDPYGMGIEMEGGKPGWYDALNGLPALFGSSMPETCELARNLTFTIQALLKYQKEVALCEEVYDLLHKLYAVIGEREIVSGKAYYEIWDAVNEIKEAYRERIYQGVSGTFRKCSAKELISILQAFSVIVQRGIEMAVSYGNGLMPTYFSYEAEAFEEKPEGIRIYEFRLHVLPYFLEGPVRYLKIAQGEAKKKDLYGKVRNSALYDRKLSMYKVNAPLINESYEIGRCKAFTPGWLENESIWLHMEYKYLLELLKAGMYEEFLEDFYKALIPFLPEEMYGRSILENSSFLASSANPNEKIYGKGFVARLSGSTVEFMDMWQIMMFGRRPFTSQGEKLVFELSPLLPDYLITREKSVEATLLGSIKTVYHVPKQGVSYCPGSYRVQEYRLQYQDKCVVNVYSSRIEGHMAEEIRAGKVNRMEVYLVANTPE